MLIGVLIDSSQHEHYGELCRDCRKPMRVGHVAMVYDQGSGVYGRDRDLMWHRHCLEYALKTAPEEHLRAEPVHA